MNAKDKLKSIQVILGVPADGIFGPKSQSALQSLITALADGPATSAPETDQNGTGGAVDARSEAAIATLHPKVQLLARKLVRSASENGITIKVTSGTRTYAEQDKLFAQGGVTKARGGQSNHNFGLALDVTIFDGAQPVWESPKYKTVGELGKRLGFTWGGDWKSIVDEPHFELRPPWATNMSESMMLAELRDRHDNHIDAFA